MASPTKSRKPAEKSARPFKSRKAKPVVPPATAIKNAAIENAADSRLGLRTRLGFTRPLFARLLNTSERTIAGVERGERSAAGLTRTYSEVERFVDALAELIDPDAIGSWLVAENDAFDGLKPVELIERGRIDQLWDMFHRLRYGMPT